MCSSRSRALRRSKIAMLFNVGDIITMLCVLFLEHLISHLFFFCFLYEWINHLYCVNVTFL